jgi:flagellar biosynthesis/type III secretory pathway protein FliH
MNNGYDQGYRAGRADRNDRWNNSYRNSYGYQDARYGYDNYYVSLNEYQYYFRQGFQRGYQDGYYGRSRYGRYSNGGYNLLGKIVGGIINLFRF